MPPNRRASKPRVGARGAKPGKASPPVREPSGSERRSAVRRHVLQTGKICFGEKLAFAVDCIIHDLSSGGMRVQVDTGGVRGMRAHGDDSANVPSELIIVHLKENAAYKAKVAWRRRGSMGLQFLLKLDLDEQTTEAQLLHQLCAEYQLRRRRAEFME